MDRFNEESVVKNHFVGGIAFEGEGLHEHVEHDSGFDQSKMLTDAISGTSVEGDEREGGHALFVEPSFRLEVMGIFEVLRVSVDSDGHGLNEGTLGNRDILEHMVLEGNTVEELTSRSIETLGFLDGTVKVGELEESVLRVIGVVVKFILEFLLDICSLSEIPDGHTAKMTSGVHTSNVESHEFTDDFFK